MINYLKHKSELVKLASRGALCYNCLARTLCEKMCKASKIDKSRENAPCEQVFETWVDKEAR